ncbi:MAG: LysM peptidoglycan-binding domain-containing protein [Peptococcaceae bacterium]|nr:LysM peptidoglycan-binding domain-containing protein [Candidatus Syntrophopropionicum ammoniitolerans]
MTKYVNKVFPTIVALTLVVSCVVVPPAECSHHSDAQFRNPILTYKVHKGDTLYDIALVHQVKLSALMQANNLTGSLIKPGDILTLPPREGNKLSDSISPEEITLLARLIYAEARGESFLGQVAVGAVTLNRLISQEFPNTLTKVIYQKTNNVYQFSPIGDGSINMEPDDQAMFAAQRALSGEDPTGGALFFYNPDISKDEWIRTLPVINRIGNHVFATSA